MFCGNCGKKLNDDAMFCDGCGCAVGQPASGGSQFDAGMRKPPGGKLPLAIGICAAAAVVAVSSVALLAKIAADDKDSDVAINKIEKEADADRSNNKVGKNTDAADNKAEEVAVAETALNDVQNNDAEAANSDSDMRTIIIKDEPAAWRSESQSKLKGRRADEAYVDVISGIIRKDDFYLCSSGFRLTERDRNYLTFTGAYAYVETESVPADTRAGTIGLKFTKGYLETTGYGQIDCYFSFTTEDSYGENLMSTCRLFLIKGDVVDGLKNPYMAYYALEHGVLYCVDSFLMSAVIGDFVSEQMLDNAVIDAYRATLPPELSVENMRDSEAAEWRTYYCIGSTYYVETDTTIHSFKIDFNEDNTRVTGITYLESTPIVYTYKE